MQSEKKVWRHSLWTDTTGTVSKENLEEKQESKVQDSQCADGWGQGSGSLCCDVLGLMAASAGEAGRGVEAKFLTVHLPESFKF